MKKLILAVLTGTAVLSLSVPAFAGAYCHGGRGHHQEYQSSRHCFSDADRDNVCDSFCDDNEDGICDNCTVLEVPAGRGCGHRQHCR